MIYVYNVVLSGSTTHLLLGKSDEDPVSMLYPHYYNDSALLLRHWYEIRHFTKIDFNRFLSF